MTYSTPGLEDFHLLNYKRDCIKEAKSAHKHRFYWLAISLCAGFSRYNIVEDKTKGEKNDVYIDHDEYIRIIMA
jgi:hypothetical protein